MSGVCRLCPRECGADRSVKKGFCGESEVIRIARAEPHMWEEPCISGKNGSGAVFFCGCCMRCCYCQNHEISQSGKGFEVTERELADIFISLEKRGVHNINLVNPTHFVPQIINALDMAKLKIPVVYNSGGYEKPETLSLTGGRIKIFLPDIKYFDDKAAVRYSSAPHYFGTAIKAVKEMLKLAGKPVFKDGIMQSGVIVRHLVLPNRRHDSIEIIRALGRKFAPDEIIVSLMSQYVPCHKAASFPELDRKTSAFEYKSVIKELETLGFDGFIQERTAADTAFVPEFFGEKRGEFT